MTKDFLGALKKKQSEGLLPVIPDVKCRSPKEGDLMRGRDPVRYALLLESAGAPVISVVTEEQEFGGSMDLFRKICSAVQVPVLRKDFIEDVSDLRETLSAGGAAILLMYACLGKEKLEMLYHEALRMGLMPLVETHTEEELRMAKELGAPLVGINNRDILILERDGGDVSHAASLLKEAPEDAFVVVESGLMSGADLRRAVKCGADAALVGTAILKADDTAGMYRSLTRPSGLKVCGLMDGDGVELCIRERIDILGFVTEYPVPVPWNLSRRETSALLELARSRVRTCVVTGGSIESVTALAEELRPDYIQLHYKETFAETEAITRRLLEKNIGVIRSIPTDPAMRTAMFGTCETESIFAMLGSAGVKVGLLDTRDASSAAGGGGSILDQGKRLTLPPDAPALMIGGGISKETIRAAFDLYHPDLIDVMSGSEQAPGKKDASLVKALVGALEGRRRGDHDV